MKEQTIRIIKGFINEMLTDGDGWEFEAIGSEAYQLFRLLENPGSIPLDKK